MVDTMTVAEFKKASKGTKRGSPEHDEQVALFDWANIMGDKHPELRLMFAVPNGAFYGRYWSTANKMKAEGVKKGVPDVFLPIPVAKTDKKTGEITKLTAGLWIEMKAGKNKTSPEQDEWIAQLREYGYDVSVCYGAQEAIKVISEYLSLDEK